MGLPTGSGVYGPAAMTFHRGVPDLRGQGSSLYADGYDASPIGPTSCPQRIPSQYISKESLVPPEPRHRSAGSDGYRLTPASTVTVTRASWRSRGLPVDACIAVISGGPASESSTAGRLPRRTGILGAGGVTAPARMGSAASIIGGRWSRVGVRSRSTALRTGFYSGGCAQYTPRSLPAPSRGCTNGTSGDTSIGDARWREWCWKLRGRRSRRNRRLHGCWRRWR